MAFIKKGQKKTYISTFKFDLKTSAALQTPLDVPRRTENGFKPMNREQSCQKSGESGERYFYTLLIPIDESSLNRF